jgi:hypothetical protein
MFLGNLLHKARGKPGFMFFLHNLTMSHEMLDDVPLPYLVFLSQPPSRD